MSVYLHLLLVIFGSFANSEPPSYSFPYIDRNNQYENQQKWTPLPPLSDNSLNANNFPLAPPLRPQSQENQPNQENPDPNSSSCPPNEPHKNKQLVLDAYNGLAKDPKSVENLFDPDYIQHNPGIADGRDAIIFDPEPIQGVEFMKISTEGDLVWTLAKLKLANNDTYIAADIFRIECARIKEHWDVLEMEGNQTTRG